MRTIDTILFIYSEQPEIDRGWDPHHTKIELSDLGFKIEELFVNEKANVINYFKNNVNNLLVWPVCYTIGSDVDGYLLVDVLDQLGIPYIGPSSESLKLNSKILFKQRLKGTRFKTPDYLIVNTNNLDSVDFQFPYVMKSEYSCDSKGIYVVNNILESRYTYDLLHKRYKQRIFVEKWERKQEYTVAYIPNKTQPIVAPLEMIIINGAKFIDFVVKNRNDYLRFELSSIDMHDRLINYVSNFADFMRIDGHFRIDILLNEHNILNIIDINFLPQMNSSQESLSYFPMCFQLNYRFSFQQVIHALLESARIKNNCLFVSKISDKIQVLEFLKQRSDDSKKIAY